jgi:hypothetical protein
MRASCVRPDEPTKKFTYRTHETHENRLGTDVETFTHRCKGIVDGLDDKRVAYPDESGGRERCSRPSSSGKKIEQRRRNYTPTF